MLRLQTPAPVAARLLARMMRTDDEDGIATVEFGNPVDFEETDDWDTASLSGEVGQSTVESTQAAAFVRTTETPSIREWLIQGIGASRGVFSAWPSCDGLKSVPTERVLLLSQNIPSGRSAWWLHKFKTTLFSRKDSYTQRPDVVIYRVGGEPSTGWNWFPRGSLYGMNTGVIDSFLHFGLTVAVRRLPMSTSAPLLDTQIAQCAVTIFLELEAATLGVAPPVFASMLVYDEDKYSSKDINAPSKSDGSNHVTGIVVASQLHTFHLGDMLQAYNSLRPEENKLLLQQQIQAASVDIVAKIQRLANAKIVKLNLCASTTVFCPHLGESLQGDDWVLSGFGFKTADFELIAGKPHLTEYDSRLCKRLAAQTEYDVNCAIVLMVAVFLAAIRAEFGAASTLVARAVLGQNADGIPFSSETVTVVTAAFSTASQKSDGFRDAMLRTFQHSRAERDPLPAHVFDELVADFTDMLKQPVTAIGTQPNKAVKPRFHSLVLHLVGARSYAENCATSNDQLAADEAQARKQRAYISKLIRQRQERVHVRAKMT